VKLLPLRKPLSFFCVVSLRSLHHVPMVMCHTTPLDQPPLPDLTVPPATSTKPKATRRPRTETAVGSWRRWRLGRGGWRCIELLCLGFGFAEAEGFNALLPVAFVFCGTLTLTLPHSSQPATSHINSSILVASFVTSGVLACIFSGVGRSVARPSRSA